MGIAVLQGTLPENTDLEYITSVSFTAASSVNIDNCFSADFQHYMVTRNFSGSAAGNEVAVRLRVSGSDSATGYRFQRVYAYSTTVAGSRSTTSTEFFRALGITETTAIGMGRLYLSNPFEAVRTTGWSDYGMVHTGDIEIQRVVHAHDLATSYTGFTVIPSSGTITGSITVWGIAS